jgi:hypothetical protein
MQWNIIDRFRPGINSASCYRSQSELNINSSISKFVSLIMDQQKGNSYIRGDSLSIKMLGDFGCILSCVASPIRSLSLHVQQAMIKQELKIRAKQQLQNTVQAENELIPEETID